MDQNKPVDYYEVLNVSPNADVELIQRVFRLLARRYHPDNQRTGNATLFRQLHEAYTVLNDPEKRAQYDVIHETQLQQKWRLLTSAAQAENDFEAEQALRLTLPGFLHAAPPGAPLPGAVSGGTGGPYQTPREHLEFATWFLVQKNFLVRSDSSSLTITAGGVEYLEQHYLENMRRRRRLRDVNVPDAKEAS